MMGNSHNTAITMTEVTADDHKGSPMCLGKGRGELCCEGEERAVVGDDAHTFSQAQSERAHHQSSWRRGGFRSVMFLL